MNIVMILIGIALGTASAWGLYQCFRWLRMVALTPVVVVGWIAVAIMLTFIVMYTHAYLLMRNDPMAPMGPVWGCVAALLMVVVIFCASIAFFQGRLYQMGWAKAFAVLIAEAGAIALIWLTLQSGVYIIADIVRGGNREVEQILASYDTSRLLLTSCEFTITGVVLLLEGLHASLISRKRKAGILADPME